MMAFWRSVYRQSQQGCRRGELESEELVRVTPALATGNIFQENNCGAMGNKQQVGRRPNETRKGGVRGGKEEEDLFFPYIGK